MKLPVQISHLPAAGPLLGSELLVVVQGGVTSRARVVDVTAGLIPDPYGPGPGVYTTGARLTPLGNDGTIQIDSRGLVVAITPAT
jgi:hypothetical protein